MDFFLGDFDTAYELSQRVLELDPSRIRNWQVGRARANRASVQDASVSDVSQASQTDDYRVSPSELALRPPGFMRFIFVVCRLNLDLCSSPRSSSTTRRCVAARSLPPRHSSVRCAVACHAVATPIDCSRHSNSRSTAWTHLWSPTTTCCGLVKSMSYVKWPCRT